jgi:hypothetical protein
VSVDPPVLLAPSDGAIREALLAVPPEDFTEDGDLTRVGRGVLQGVARALGPDVHLLLHAWPRHRAALERALVERGVRRWTFVASAFGYYTRWAQDLVVVQRRRGGAVWLFSEVVARRFDASVAPEIATTLRRAARAMPFAFQGGDLVPFGRRVYAGADLAAERDRVAIAAALAPGQEWIWIGTRAPGRGDAPWRGQRQPLFHLNMFLTALGTDGDGREHVLLGSPRLARRLLGEARDRDDDDGAYDEIADALRARGVRVTRLPLLIQRRSDEAALVTYNNVLQAERPRLACLPRYGRADAALARLDAEAARTYESAGWPVRWAEGPWDTLAEDWGSLLCTVMVTRRGD